MKKLISIIGIFTIVLLSGNVYAETASQVAAGGEVTVDDAGAGQGFKYMPSPGTLVQIASTATDYTIVTGNAKTTGITGIAYALVSADANIYQLPITEPNESTLGDVTSITAGAVPTGFTAKGSIATTPAEEPAE